MNENENETRLWIEVYLLAFKECSATADMKANSAVKRFRKSDKDFYRDR